MATNTSGMIAGPKPARGLRHTFSRGWMRVQSVRPGDAGTAARAQLRILRTLGASGEAISTSAVGGYVELRGSVPSNPERERAAQLAGSTFGAKGVLNFLEIK